MNLSPVGQNLGIVPSNTPNASATNQNAINAGSANFGASQLPVSSSGTTFSSQISPAGNTIGSNYLAPTSFQDLGSAYQNKLGAMNNGLGSTGNPAVNGSPLQPSASLQKQLAAQLYQSSLYTPQEQQLISQNADLNSQINHLKNSANIQAQNAYESGNMTQGEFNSLTGAIQTKANQSLANLTTQQSDIANQMNVYGLQRQNSITANQNLLTALAPTSVSPGSTLYNPITGVQFQGAGAAPATILAQAQTLLSNDEATGQVHYTPTGQVDEGYYQQLAASQFGGGTTPSGNGSLTTTGATAGATTGTNQTQTGTASLSPQFQSYVIQPTDGTPSYINSSLVDPAVLPALRQQANAAGIKVFDAGISAQIQNLQGAIQNVNALGTVANGTLASGTVGRGTNVLANAWNNLFQNNPALQAFNQARTTAINDIKGLAGGEGSGLRLNSAEIGIATSNLPSATDNLETAQTKIAWVNAFLQQSLALKMTGDPSSAVITAAQNSLIDTAQKAAKAGNYDPSVFASTPSASTTSTTGTGGTYKSNSGATYNLPY